MIKNDWDKKLRRAATGSKEQVSQLGQDLIDMNYDDWTEGESYESLVKRYQGKGQKAMDDTIGQVAARTGGLASSYAAQAGQQAYGGWMENLENAARSLYDTERQELMDRYNIANDMYTQQRDEARYIDKITYQRGRDAIADQRYNSAAAAEELEMRLGNGEDITTLSDLIELSGKPASYWAAYQDNESSNKAEADAAEAEAIADVQMYLASGKTASEISPDLIAATGKSVEWWDTWKKANTVVNAPEFRSVSAGDVEKYSAMVADLVKEMTDGKITETEMLEDAESLLNAIIAATGNEDFAINLIYATVPGLEDYLGKKYSQ